MPAKTEKPNISEYIVNFIQKNRKALLISLSGLVVIIIIFIAVFAIQDSLSAKAYIKVDELNSRYEAIMNNADEEQPLSAALINDIILLLEDVAQFTDRNSSGYAAARAYAISADMYELMSNWHEAENAWADAARAATGTYFAPVAYFNAAVAAEEQGNNTRAIELYNNALEYGSDFPSAPRAQFSVGRIQESQGDRLAAIATYQSLVGRWPEDQVWTNLAQSRILILSIELY